MQGEAIELKKARLVDIPGEENLVRKNPMINKHPTNNLPNIPTKIQLLREQMADKTKQQMPTIYKVAGGPLPITNELITPINGYGFISYSYNPTYEEPGI